MIINRQSIISCSAIRHMRHFGFLSVLLFFLFLSCKESTKPENDQVQPTWLKNPNNPVLNTGQSGSWDDSSVELSSVIFDGSIYHMWYTVI